MADAREAEREAAQGYQVEVPYVDHYCDELTPLRLCYAAAINGYAPPDVSRPFSFCDLGCGSGFTLNLLASLNPDSRFVGVDIMAEHIAEAKRVATVAGLDNVRFIEAGFADLADHELEPFDFITAHGVYTWVAPEIQRQLVNALGRMLTTDGLIYLGYNVLPGWAAMVPLRNLMVQVAEAAEGDLQTRVAKAADTIRRLRDGEAKYFRDYPVAGQIFDDTAKFGTNYLAHEYFGEHWQPVYFQQVATAMAGAGLSYAGSVDIFDNFVDYALPAEFHTLVVDPTDRLSLESFKDLVNNRVFRRDVFIRSGRDKDGDALNRFMDRVPFGSLQLPHRIAPVVKLPYGEMRMDGDGPRRICERVGLGVADLGELAGEPHLQGWDRDNIRDVVCAFSLAGMVQPFAGRLREVQGADADRFRLTSAFNREALRIGARPDVQPTIAVPASGGGLRLPPLDALSLEAVVTVGRAGAADWLDAVLDTRKMHIVVHDPGKGGPSRRDTLARYVSEFAEGKLPKLIALGAVEADV